MPRLRRPLKIPKAIVTIYLPVKALRALDAAALRGKLSRSALVDKALVRYLGRMG